MARAAWRLDEMVEAAAKGIYYERWGHGWKIEIPAVKEAVRAEARSALIAALPALGDDVEHCYLSTGCLHGDCEHCRCVVALDGRPKVPNSCKFCGARCICPCHIEDRQGGA